MKLTEEGKRRQAEWIAEDPARLQAVEVAVYTMIGGGFLGASAINQPEGFYIDSRVGRLPYPRRAILQAVEILALAHQIAGIPSPYEGAKALPNLGVF